MHILNCQVPLSSERNPFGVVKRRYIKVKELVKRALVTSERVERVLDRKMGEAFTSVQ